MMNKYGEDWCNIKRAGILVYCIFYGKKECEHTCYYAKEIDEKIKQGKLEEKTNEGSNGIEGKSSE